MKILFAASECVPFIKTGGLADVVGALSPVLAQKGVDVRVMVPLYASIPEKWTSQMKSECEFEVELGWRRQYCGVKSLEYQGVTFYFIDNHFYFGRSYIYGLGGDEYERFGFFCRAVIDALPHLGFKPDVVHCHDWQTGMVPALLKIQYAHFPFYQDMKTVYTIHNLQYQGVFPIKAVQDTLGLGDSLFTSDKLECYGCANYMKAGLVYADELTTVSPSYADEIQTAFYGERLDGLLRARKGQLSGILNGIDVDDYDPAKDPMIYANYDPYHLGGKEYCKQELQKELGLNVDPNAPIVGIISRLSNQKGLDLVECVIRELMDTGIQLVVLGMGEAKYTNLFSWAESEYPGRLAARFAMNHQLAHRIYAGADMFLMPSQFEPCGLSQMIALRYGTVRDRRPARHRALLQQVHRRGQRLLLLQLQRARHAPYRSPRRALLQEQPRGLVQAHRPRHDRRLQLVFLRDEVHGHVRASGQAGHRFHPDRGSAGRSPCRGDRKP